MTELPPSQLPQEPEYWERLARKIGEDAASPLARYATDPSAATADTEDAWYGVLARRAPWLVSAAAAAVVVFWVTLPPRSDSSVALHWIEHSLAPHEAVGTLIGGPEPPSVDALMVQFPPAPHQEGQHGEGEQ